MNVVDAIRNNRPRSIAAALVLAACAVWLSQTWSLSSYGLVLRAFGAPDDGVVVGSPRSIISDEWGIITPLTQATVNNGLRRINETSFYGEDLRMVLSMPVLDWGMAFKPAMWLYPVVNAAYAYSFQALFLLCAFVAGYALLFRRLGSGTVESVLLALVLFFTSFVQFWWGVLGPTAALFPWVVLAIGLRSAPLRFAAIMWTGAVWMLEFFYPPMFIPLAIAGGALFFALHFRRDRPAVVVVPTLAAMAACAIVVFYLRDYLAATLHTVFPGQRFESGGGVAPELFADMLWPGAHLVKFETTTKYNLAEAGVVGTSYLLFALAFLDYRRAFTASMEPHARRLTIAALVAFLILTAWQTLPIPPTWVKWTGLPWVLPRRSLFASGLLLLIIAVQLTRAYGFVFSLRRFLVLCAVVLFGWGLTKANAQAPWVWRAWPDLLVIPIGAVVLLPRRWIGRHDSAVVAGCCALFGFLAFGTFNPVQKAWPIFNRESTELTRRLDYRQSVSPQHVVVSDQFGATLNGWGYRSITHVLVAPQLETWRRLFPDLDPATFNNIFNRYAVVQLIDDPVPKLLPNGAIGVPRSRFVEFDPAASQPVEGIARAQRWNGPIARDATNGHVDSRRQNGSRFVLSGWAPWKGLRAEQMLTVVSDADLDVVRFERTPRPDVVSVHRDAALQFSGFTIEVDARRLPVGTKPRICLVAQESAAAARILVVDEASGCG